MMVAVAIFARNSNSIDISVLVPQVYQLFKRSNGYLSLRCVSEVGRIFLAFKEQSKIGRRIHQTNC
ncbi:hypothetical protein I7I53_07576 [Histoplasma capsulatum var. duboisii H88]|uniref:Uncharacterized protein n=1 Tax=Ajellomyces capsulatus (strain H88) TaxID=544711 RepID=A0A8A1LJA5_AJEC8|nr:hypothetical protein I7I53_07576 [Histoplasma capsulatum var. duboisii H88]